jgi:hypothetical protein
MSSRGPTQTVRVYKDTHEKLRTLAYMNHASMPETIAQVVDDYMERGMTPPEQGAMWKIMSAQITNARKGETNG